MRHHQRHHHTQPHRQHHRPHHPAHRPRRHLRHEQPSRLSTLKLLFYRGEKRIHFWLLTGLIVILATVGVMVGPHDSISSPQIDALRPAQAKLPVPPPLAPKPTPPPVVAPPRAPAPPSNQVKAYDVNGALQATFTVGTRTVLMTGPSRTFAEPYTTAATVTTKAWVRLYPTVFNGTIDKAWLAQMVAQNASGKSPDILGMALQYVAGAPTVKDDAGRVIAGDTSYGPLQANHQREEGADFNDYLGIPWTYGTIVDKPEVRQFGSLDCSGFLRMIWGYRTGMPLSQLDQVATGGSLPRRAYQMYQSGPGIVIAADTKHQITDFSHMQVGDIVFFDVETNDGTQIDHVGMYLGLDSQGHQRVISSRKAADGPTLGDVGGKSILDGNGLFAQNFRAVRRF